MKRNNCFNHEGFGFEKIRGNAKKETKGPCFALFASLLAQLFS